MQREGVNYHDPSAPVSAMRSHDNPIKPAFARAGSGAKRSGGMGWMFAVIFAAAPVWGEPVTVPSGQTVEFLDLVRDVEGTADNTWRFRFVAPRIARDGGDIPIDVALADIDMLCAGFVLDRLAETGESPEQVIISLSDRPVTFGASAPEATQIFEAYRIEDRVCIWEGF